MEGPFLLTGLLTAAYRSVYRSVGLDGLGEDVRDRSLC
jgi:hypothetical protein